MSDARLKAFCEGLEMQDIPKLMTGTVGDFRRVGEVMQDRIVEKFRRIEALEAERDDLYRQLEKCREERNAARVKYEQPLLARVAELEQSRAEIERSERELFIKLAEDRINHEARAAAYYSGTFHLAYEYHVKRHGGMIDLLDVLKEAARIRAEVGAGAFDRLADLCKSARLPGDEK